MKHVLKKFQSYLTKKNIQDTKRKSSVPPDSNPLWIHFVALYEHFVVLLSFLNIYIND